MNQLSLFPIVAQPEGFIYQADFLSQEEEADLLRVIRGLEFQVFDFRGFKAKRRIVAYGWDYDFASRKATPGRAIPDFLFFLQKRCAEFIGVRTEDIVEAVVTEYPPTAPIGWHRDVAQFETISGISLLSSCRMRLRPFNREGRSYAIALEPRSIYMLSGAARWNFQHSIPAVEQLRYSITFRTLRQRQEKQAG